MDKEINSVKSEPDACRRMNTKGKLETPSDWKRRELPRTVGRQVLPPHDHHRKLYSNVVVGHEERKCKLTHRSKDSQTPDVIKRLIKVKS